ncbi:MAG TPA: hypothetical protein VF553_06760 [Pyrinomonadaceae bacterium]
MDALIRFEGLLQQLHVGSIFRTIKTVFFWSYGRTTWQYDVLCALILAFIFLTPRSWFETSEPRNTPAHQSRFDSVLIEPVSPSDNLDMGEIERRVRAHTGRPETQVIAVRPKLDAAGHRVAYEVDIQ